MPSAQQALQDINNPTTPAISLSNQPTIGYQVFVQQLPVNLNDPLI